MRGLTSTSARDQGTIQSEGSKGLRNLLLIARYKGREYIMRSLHGEW
jgi:hypothetical protein